MFALSSKITFAKTVVDRASSRRASKRDAHVVKVRTARMDSDRARAVVPTMSADGEHETLYEMFDPGWVAATVGIYSAVLLKFAGIF